MSTVDLEQLVTWRRELHRFPEIGWSEFTTTARLIKELRAMGLEVFAGPKVINREFVRGRKAEVVEKGLALAKERGVDEALLAEMEELTGCMAVYDSGKPGPTVALRFDIDCVNVQECATAEHVPNKDGFASKSAGLMHACGHDGHMSIGLGIAKWLVENGSSLSGKVKLLFQPAEEGVRGASAMAASGIVDDADYFLGMHLGFIAKTGEIVVNPNNFLCTTKFDFRFYGAPAHAGAEPHLGRNALAGACHAATQMLGISRHGKGMSRINVGVIKAGEGRNVVPAYGELQVEVRGEDEAINTFMAEQVQRMAEGAAHSFELRLESEVMGEAVDLVNDKELVDLLTGVVKQHAELTVVPERSFGGSEDATILAKRVQRNGGKSIYFIVGADLTAGHHQAGFDFDEKQLKTAADLFIGCLQKLMNK
ncbi:p-aminobenzoyl-glutamate hydrolase subunit A [Leminorella grimontii]|uniref:p-aminobenzoyl-glutamate hydrolase subunit A n=1 Tax=Leminorella grimontii TaxID=82981 RepID=A0AAV5N1F9_9GAMM|nr:amidohydrolase [Leminorella grimontii]KFC96302.1 M20 family peptidase [Leminorella grimontii ATCC 33999 = DSM 5078]GKX54507.1 p-aminobenzoyl-glutamate hydrolase subunit A [Leminorella grimontii]GKX57924.1 p-aminobenzoyl-glutamate hydrolase subunit A [Leminorella grimontii]VFS59064.1 Indole-3-acetyl-aspartic acid hydrolase [Leminorella grimontii]